MHKNAGSWREQPSRNLMSTLERAALASAALLALAACSKAQGETKLSDGPPVVGVITIRAEPVALTAELPGRTTPFLISDVRPQVTGLIRERLYREGANVQAGQPLYKIDPAPFQAAYDGQKAALARAEANLITVKLKAERYDELIKINAVSRQDYNDTVAIAAQGEADVAAANASLESARINLANTRVTAPISGRAGPSAFTPGALVTAQQSAALTTIQTLDPIYVDLVQSSAELLRLRREFGGGANLSRARVKLMLEDGSTYPLEGELRVSDITVDPTSGAVTLRAIFRNPDGLLLPGMFVRAVLDEAQAPSAVLAPQPAISRDAQGRATAFVVSANGKVEVRAITASRTVGARWLVTSGLNPGDRLIVDGVQRVKPGMAVRTAPASSAAAVSWPAA